MGSPEIEQAVEPDCGIEEAVKHDGRSILCVYHCHLFGVSMLFGLEISIQEFWIAGAARVGCCF
jgi:hypothetical protein